MQLKKLSDVQRALMIDLGLVTENMVERSNETHDVDYAELSVPIALWVGTYMKGLTADERDSFVSIVEAYINDEITTAKV